MEQNPDSIVNSENEIITRQSIIDKLGDFLKGLMPLEKYLFNWKNVPGNDSNRLINCLENNFEVDHINIQDIKKSEDKYIINIITIKKQIEIKLNEANRSGLLKISSRKKYKLEVKENNNGEFEIYMKIYKENSLSPFTIGFFKWWINDIENGDERFEAQCEKDLYKNWNKYIELAKIPECLRSGDVCRELLNIDCTWVPKYSGPYYISPDSTKQMLPTQNPSKSYIFLAFEHAEDNSIILNGSNMGSVITAIRKLGYIRSFFKIVIYKPFKGESIKNDQKIREQLNRISQEINRIGLHQDKEKTEIWYIIMLFNYYEISSIEIGENDLLLRGYEMDSIGEIINIDDKEYSEYQIKDLYA